MKDKCSHFSFCLLNILMDKIKNNMLYVGISGSHKYTEHLSLQNSPPFAHMEETLHYLGVGNKRLLS